MKKRSFTLIEVLLATGIIAAVIGSGTIIMYTVLRSARKSESVAGAKTEGEYVMRRMDEMLRYGKRVVCGVNSVTLTRMNDTTVTYAIDSGNVSSNSSVLNSNAYSFQSCGGTNPFVCTGERGVSICFVVTKSGTSDVTTAVGLGTNGVKFSTTVELRNFGN